MCFTFKKNNKQTEKLVNRFLHFDASSGIRSLQTSIEIKLCQSPWNGLLVRAKSVTISDTRHDRSYSITLKVQFMLTCLLSLKLIIVPQLSKCLKFEAIRGDQTDQRICI